VQPRERFVVRVVLSVDHKDERPTVFEELRFRQRLPVEVDVVLELELSWKIPHLELNELIVCNEFYIERVRRF